MSKYLTVIPLLLSALALGAASPAIAGAAGTPAGVKVQTHQSRLGGGFRARPSFGSRSRSRYRSPYYRRNSRPFRGLGGSILRVLGIAYLAHLLFGWGAGGSPLGLILLVGLIAFIATRGRRRRYAY
jgi:hypothetical protein